MFHKITCHGYRGFQTKQELILAQPKDNKRGSGLTVLVGPNGGGKSTIIESFRKIPSYQGQEVSFTEGRVNKKAGDKVEISTEWSEGENIQIGKLQTVKSGGSETAWAPKTKFPPAIYVLPSRRIFNPYFGKGSGSREEYIRQSSGFTNRGASLDSFSSRLFHAIRRYDDFTAFFSKILGSSISWTIAQSDQGNYYVKIMKSDAALVHNSEGMGEGVVSLLFLVDAIFDTKEGDLVVIDEPELSLHPQLQRRLMDAFLEFTKTRQLVIATHSPEMVSVEALENGGTIARIVEEKDGSKIYQLSEVSKQSLAKLRGGANFPHSLGYDARSCFFEEDGLVITEGQEDVVIFRKVLDQLSLDPIRFWGYGAGGASNLIYVADVLKSMGFKKIAAIFDGDKKLEAEAFKSKYAEFNVSILPTNDIRDKEAQSAKEQKEGMTDKSGILKEKYKEKIITMLSSITEYIKG